MSEGRGVTDPRPRILMLVANNPFPADVRVFSEASTLAAAGYAVSVIAPREPGEPHVEDVEGVHVCRYRLSDHSGGFWGYVVEFLHATVASFFLSIRLLGRRGFDVVHVFGPPDTLGLIGGLYKLLGKRMVYDHRDLSSEMYSARFGAKARRVVRWTLTLIERACCRMADLVIVPNDSYRTYDIDFHGIDPARIAPIRIGPRSAFLEPTEPSAAIRDSAEGVIGYVGVIGPQDGVDSLIRVVRHLVVDLGRSGIRCVIIGYGDALDEVKALAIDLGVSEHTWFTGRLEGRALRNTLAAADICVAPDPSNPYTDRSTLVKMMEYMALGKPIVCFDLPEHRVSAGSAAIYVPGNDEAGFANAIVELLDDPQRRRTMGEYGRRRVEDSLMWSHSAPRLLEAYDELLERREKAEDRM